MRRTTVSALLFSALAIAATGCGTGSPSATATTGTKATTAAKAKTQSGSSPTTARAASAGSGTNPGSSFCQAALQEKSQETKEEQAFTTDTPAQLEKFEQEALAALPKFFAAAPSQIKGAAQVIISADQKVFNALKAADFNFTKLGSDSALASSFESPTFLNAVKVIDNYLGTVCGISIPTTPTT